MTPRQFIEQQLAKIPELEKATGRAVGSVHALQTERIFTEGQKATGGEIGQYDTSRELYVSPNRAPKKFKPKGKTGKSTFKDGTPHQTGYYESYAAFRQSQGRQTARVDLNMTGQLQSDFANSLQQTRAGVWVAGTRNRRNTVILRGHIDKYGAEVFKVSEKERQALREALLFERRRIGI